MVAPRSHRTASTRCRYRYRRCPSTSPKPLQLDPPGRVRLKATVVERAAATRGEIRAYYRSRRPVLRASNQRNERSAHGHSVNSRRDVERRAELIWYVRDQNIINNLKRLPEYPLSTINGWVLVTALKCFGSPVSGSDFRVFPFLTPIIAPDNRIAEALTIDNDDVGILCVHLISCAEYEFIRTAGLDPSSNARRASLSASIQSQTNV